MLPVLLRPEDLIDRTVVVFDVLRATTTIAAALTSRAKEIWAFDSLDAARAAAAGVKVPHLTVGEKDAVRPADFDFGNSPGDFTPETCGGRTIVMATTNGTRAMIAARSAADLFAGALVNATATARAIAAIDRPITLLCSGTQGNISTEDLLGCGAVLAGIEGAEVDNDSAQIAKELWARCQANLYGTLYETFGGHHIRRAGLTPDISFAASVDRFDTVCQVHDRNGQLIVTAEGRSGLNPSQ